MTQVLDLAAVFDRDTVKTKDGSTYELRNQQEFGIVDDHRLRALLEKIDKVDKTGAASEQEAEDASKLLRELAAMIVIDCPDSISDWECVAIFQFWMERAAKEAPAPPPKPRRRTSAASSRGSKPSIAATRKRGSTSRSGS